MLESYKGPMSSCSPVAHACAAFQSQSPPSLSPVRRALESGSDEEGSHPGVRGHDPVARRILDDECNGSGSDLRHSAGVQILQRPGGTAESESEEDCNNTPMLVEPCGADGHRDFNDQDDADDVLQVSATESPKAYMAEAPEAQIVAAESAEQWTGMLPPEATGTWEVSEEVCSLPCSGANMKLPRPVYDRLYKYQRQGAVWMWNLYHKGFGGILADEMGLGKTVQTAAFLACLKFTNQGARFLVVVPVTLLEQWRRELDTWAQNTGLAVHVMHGAPHERKAALRGAAQGGVLLISYDLVRTFSHQICTTGLA